MRWFIVLFFFSIALQAQQNSVLWEVSGNELTQPTYLFGTIHLQDKRVFCFPDSVEIVFDKSSWLALEIVIDEQSMKEMAQHILIRDKSQSLKNILTKAEYKKVKKTVREYLPIEHSLLMDKVLPALLAAELMSAQTAKDEKYPMDLFLQKKAQDKGKELYALESVASQMLVLNKIPIETQKQELLSVVDSMELYKNMLEDMISLYQQQKIDSLFTISDTYNSSFDKEWEIDLLDERNKLMIEKLKVKMKVGGGFVAVGAGHLPGEKGLIQLLEKEGYQVRPVYSKCNKDE